MDLICLMVEGQFASHPRISRIPSREPDPFMSSHSVEIDTKRDDLLTDMMSFDYLFTVIRHMCRPAGATRITIMIAIEQYRSTSASHHPSPDKPY